MRRFIARSLTLLLASCGPVEGSATPGGGSADASVDARPSASITAPIATLFRHAPGFSETIDGDVLSWASGGGGYFEPEIKGARSVATYGAIEIGTNAPTEIDCAARADGSVVCRGSGVGGGLPFAPSGTCHYESNGALFSTPGDATYPCEPDWRVVDGLTDVVEVAGPCARTDEGAISCWPWPAGPRTNAAPNVMTLPRRATRLDSTGFGACAVLDDGEVACWGNSEGLPPRACSLCELPTVVPGLGGVVDLALSVFGFGGCLVERDGSAQCWGTSVPGGTSDTPLTMLASATAFASLSAGWDGTCALATDGRVSCWRTVFDDGVVVSTTPQTIAGLAPATQLVSEIGSVLYALHADGSVDRVERFDDALRIDRVARGSTVDAGAP